MLRWKAPPRPPCPLRAPALTLVALASGQVDVGHTQRAEPASSTQDAPNSQCISAHVSGAKESEADTGDAAGSGGLAPTMAPPQARGDKVSARLGPHLIRSHRGPGRGHLDTARTWVRPPQAYRSTAQSSAHSRPARLPGGHSCRLRAGEGTRGLRLLSSLAPEPGPMPAWCGSGRGLSSEARSTGTGHTGGSAWLGTDHCPSLTGAAAPAVSDDATEVPEAGLTAVTLEAPNTRAAGALTRGWVTGATVGAMWVAVAGTCKARAGCGHRGSVAPRSSGVGLGRRTHWGSQPGLHPGPPWRCPGSSRRESGCSVGGPRGAAGPRWGLQGEAEGSDGRHGHVSTVGLATQHLGLLGRPHSALRKPPATRAWVPGARVTGEEATPLTQTHLYAQHRKHAGHPKVRDVPPRTDPQPEPSLLRLACFHKRTCTRTRGHVPPTLHTSNTHARTHTCAYVSLHTHRHLCTRENTVNVFTGAPPVSPLRRGGLPPTPHGAPPGRRRRVLRAGPLTTWHLTPTHTDERSLSHPRTLCASVPLTQCPHGHVLHTCAHTAGNTKATAQTHTRLPGPAGPLTAAGALSRDIQCSLRLAPGLLQLALGAVSDPV